MAIFGALNELPIPEILTMLGRRSGKLKLWNLESKHRYELHMHEAKLKALYIDQQAVNDIMFVRESMIELIDAEQGSFEFERHPPDSLSQQLDIPVEQLLLSTATAIDEMKAYRQRFADQRTRFRSVGPVDVWLDDNLYMFWQYSSHLLENGCSAEEVAEHLNMQLDQVQLNLYKLRSLGKIAPVRAYQESHVGRQSRKAEAASDIIDWDGSAQSGAQPTAAEKPPKEKPRKEEKKDKGLVNRLLKALSFGRRS